MMNTYFTTLFKQIIMVMSLVICINIFKNNVVIQLT